MMNSDLKTGVVGALEELYPGIKSDDLYHTARRGGMDDIPEMGDLVLTGAEWETSIMWWNAETIGNWWEGFVRHAFHTENRPAIAKATQIVEGLVASQDADGYVGIYKPNLRYKHEGSNGELWAQTTAFRTMLSYYEFTGDTKVLESVERGMELTMKNYGEEAKNPFHLKNAFGGVTHGLMLTDVCETLYRITGKEVYRDYATYLYKAFSTYSINRSFNDMRYPYLMEKDSMFEGHAVHTYEHIRAMVAAYYYTGYPELEEVYDNMFYKLEKCILPSGAGHGNEWIAKMTADPEHTSSEYCTLVELRNSYGSLIQKTGDIAFSDAAEKLTYNGLLGFRNKNGTAIAYGKPDNCYVLDGKHHENGKATEDPRYKYSPTHSEPAVCCVPNYGRNLSYFLEQMWMKTNDGIAAVMYGPSQLTTNIDGVDVGIEQVTLYPQSDEVTFRISLSDPLEFTLYLRNPGWSEDIVFSESKFEKDDDYYALKKTWTNGEEFTITFNNKTTFKKALNGEAYLQRGPLVFAYEIPHTEKEIKNYNFNNYQDFYCFADDKKHLNLTLLDQYEFIKEENSTSSSFYDIKTYLEGYMMNLQTNEKELIRLVPMGKTILRRVTFPS